MRIARANICGFMKKKKKNLTGCADKGWDLDVKHVKAHRTESENADDAAEA